MQPTKRSLARHSNNIGKVQRRQSGTKNARLVDIRVRLSCVRPCVYSASGAAHRAATGIHGAKGSRRAFSYVWEKEPVTFVS